MGGVVSSQRPGMVAWIGGVVAPLAVFLGLAARARTGRAFGWEGEFLLGLHRIASPGLDSAAIWCSRVFFPQWLVVIAALIAVGFALRRRWAWVVVTLALVPGALLLNTAIKAVVQRPRPILWPSLTGETSSGFPSGHAMTSLAFAALIVLLLRHIPWRGAALAVAAVWVALVGLARLALGVHYPTDVLAGWCASLAWVAAVRLLARRAGVR